VPTPPPRLHVDRPRPPRGTAIWSGTGYEQKSAPTYYLYALQS